MSVHRSDCANAVTLTASMGERQIEVEWDGARAGVFVASIEVEALDRARLLGDVSTALADHHVNIVASVDPHRLRPGGPAAVRLRAGRPVALDALLESVKRVDCGVRRLPGPARQPALTQPSLYLPTR